MIKIITVGKIKEKYYTEAVNEYIKRLSKYTKINLIEVKDEDFDISKTLLKEKESIMKYIDEKDYVITLEIEGEELDSVSLSKKLDDIKKEYNDLLNKTNDDDLIEAQRVLYIYGAIKKLNNY